MADQKVSDLPSLNGADVDAADLLYIIDSSAGSAGSKKITVGQYQLAPVSAGTANGVVYLDASKALTTGSGLTYNGTNLDISGGSYVGTKFQIGSEGAGSLYLTTGYLRFANGATETMRLDASGNLGLGVTPSAWGAGYAAFQIKSGGVALWSDGAQRFFLSANVYYDGTNRRYQTTGVATEYVQNGGAHQWYTAPSGTAGNAISFTQAMTLDASGNLGVGTTSATGSLTNNTKLVQGVATSYNGTVSAANATAVTMFVVPTPSDGATFLVTVTLGAPDIGSTYTVLGLLRGASATTSYTNIVTAANLTVSLSGTNLQVTQSSGLTQTVQWSLLRLV